MASNMPDNKAAHAELLVAPDPFHYRRSSEANPWYGLRPSNGKMRLQWSFPLEPGIAMSSIPHSLAAAVI